MSFFYILDDPFEYAIILWVVLEIFIIRWTLSLKPEKNMIDKYDKKVIFFSHLPFGNSWKSKVAKEDIELFESYQHRIKIWYLSLIVPLILFFVYQFIKSFILLQSFK